MMMSQATVPQNWQLITDENVQKLKRKFSFPDFRAALDFVNQVSQLAEAENHHPVIKFTWGSVTVWWWSHDVAGLSERDYRLVEKTNQVFDRFS